MAVCVLHQTGHIRLCQDDGIQIIQRYNGHLIHQDGLRLLEYLHTLTVIRQVAAFFYHAVILHGILTAPTVLVVGAGLGKAVQVCVGIQIVTGPSVKANIKVSSLLLIPVHL